MANPHEVYSPEKLAQLRKERNGHYWKAAGYAAGSLVGFGLTAGLVAAAGLDSTEPGFGAIVLDASMVGSIPAAGGLFSGVKAYAELDEALDINRDIKTHKPKEIPSAPIEVFVDGKKKLLPPTEPFQRFDLLL